MSVVDVVCLYCIPDLCCCYFVELIFSDEKWRIVFTRMPSPSTVLYIQPTVFDMFDDIAFDGCVDDCVWGV